MGNSGKTRCKSSVQRAVQILPHYYTILLFEYYSIIIIIIIIIIIWGQVQYLNKKEARCAHDAWTVHPGPPSPDPPL